jgi:peptide chain release factor 1
MELEKLEKEKEDLFKKLSNPEFLSNKKNFEKASRQLKKIEGEINFLKTLTKTEKKIKEAEEILAEVTDDELLSLAEEDLKKNKEIKEKILAEKAKKTEEDNGASKIKGIIVEIRAGTGGGEAALFAHDLFRMYNRYAEIKGWPVKIINMNKTALDGLKEGVMEINDKEAFNDLQYEAGVHRVQRIPATEKSGRIHTSTATVAILPQIKNVEIEIKTEDLEETFFRSSGPGGQNVQKVESAVRLVHKPTGLTVVCQSGRKQKGNREKALELLKNKVLIKTQEEVTGKEEKERRDQIGHAERSEKIRTYNFPQDRITDHRIKKSWHNIEQILGGNLDEIIKDIKKEYHQE